LENFQLLKESSESEWRIEEESKGELRNLKIFVGEIHAASFFEIPASKCENVMKAWSEAFKLWVQGIAISRLLNGDKEKTFDRGQDTRKAVFVSGNILDTVGNENR
jgi:hypothetical protein